MEQENIKKEVIENEVIEKGEQEKIKESEKISIKEGSANGLADGFGIRYITPYALALGASNIYIALMSSVPSLLGNINQLHTLRLMKKRTRKQIIFRTVFIQALLWIPIIFIGVFYLISNENRNFAPLLLLLAYILLIIAGATVAPAWNSWMKDLIQNNSGKYFGTRNRIIGIVSISSMIIGGLILSFFKQNLVLIGFFIIFFIAFIGRIISAYLFTKQYEPHFEYDPNSYFSLKKFIKKMSNNNFGHFVIFVSLVSFSTAIASPFFAVYMLQNLNFSYLFFTLVTISSSITIILFMPIWGVFADKFGNLKVMKITSILTPLIPFFWLLTIFLKSSNAFFILGYLILVELFSGFAWAGFNLSSGNFIYDAVTRQKMAFCVTYFNIINSTGTFFGALIGGIIASLYGSLFGINILIFIFFISGVLRFLVVIIMQGSIKEVRTVPDFKIKHHLKEKLKLNKVSIFRYIGFKPIRIEN